MAGIVLFVVFLISVFPMAAGATTIKELKGIVLRLQVELEKVKTELKDREHAPRERGQGQGRVANQIPSSPPQGQVQTQAPDDGREIVINTTGGITVARKDGSFKAQMGGRLYLDSAWYDSDKSNLGDGTEAREARLFLAGTVLSQWAYKAAFGFADNVVSAKDVTLAYTGLGPLRVTVGHFKEPFGIEESTSSRFITFMERALSSAFAPGRHLGLGLNGSGGNWTAAAGLFGSSFSDDPANEGDEGWDVAGRFAFAPVLAEGRLLHFGVSGRYNDPNDSTVTIGTEPESHLTDAKFVTTGTLADVKNTVTFGGEIAALAGPFSTQGEYVRRFVHRKHGRSDPDFGSWYVQASYFLTGETRPYSVAKGGFVRITPVNSLGGGGWGAWEVALRHSRINLSDKNIIGGGEANTTIGLNWYVNPQVRFMANYIFVNTDNDATGNSANLKSGKVSSSNDDPRIFQLRAQVDF